VSVIAADRRRLDLQVAKALANVWLRRHVATQLHLVAGGHRYQSRSLAERIGRRGPRGTEKQAAGQESDDEHILRG
jgi:hypothetical protein